MPTKRVEFFNVEGHLISARLEMPDAAPKTYAMFAHCFSCTKDTLAAVRISRRMASKGVAVLRLDFAGLGDSEGEFAETSLTSNVADLVSAASFLSQHYGQPELLIGHSFGGVAVLVAASKIEAVRAIATIGAPSGSAHIHHLVAEPAESIRKKGYTEFTLAGRAIRLNHSFIDDTSQPHVEKALRHMRKPILIFHSPSDKVVSIDQAARLYGLARHPKSFVSLDRADHLLTDVRDAAFVADILASWSTRYLSTLSG